MLRAIESVAKESAILTRDTWETLLKFLLAANDSLLSPPTEKGLYNPFMMSGFFHQFFLARSIFNFKGIRFIIFLLISVFKPNSANPYQMLQKWHLIWVYYVCQFPFYGSSGI